MPIYPLRRGCSISVMPGSKHRSLVHLCMAALALLGCSGEPELAREALQAGAKSPRVEAAPRAGAETPSFNEPDLRRVIESLGDEGAAVVVLRPQQWAALHGVLGPWLATLPPPAAELADAARATALPELLTRPLGLPSGWLPLDGWDTSRPVVASLGEVPYDGPPGAVTPQLATLEEWVPPVRHQLWVPATDPTTLAASLGTSLERVATPYPALVEARAGARAVAGEGLAIAVLPADDAVRVVVFHGATGRDEAARLEHMRGRLDVEARALPSTPALSLLLRPEGVLSVWLRPWRLRSLATWWNAVEVARALAGAAAEHRASLLARGLQIMLTTELLMTDEGAELVDAAMSLATDEGVVRLRSTMSTSPEGEAILEAAARGAGETYPTAIDDAWLDAALRIDARAMLDATTPPPALVAATGGSDVARVLAEAGPVALVYMGLRHPFGLLRVVEQQARTVRLPLPIETLPTAIQLVWRGYADDVPRVVLWTEWPKSYVDRPLAGMVPLAKREPGFESLRMDTLAPYGQPITVFALAGEGAGTFDTSKSDGLAGLLRMRAWLARIGAHVAVEDPERGAVLTALGEVGLTVEHRHGALVSELAWSPSGGAPRAMPVPVSEGDRRSSPMGSTVTAGTRCLAEAGRGVADGLDALVMVSDDALAMIVTRTLEEIEAPLGCAAEEPETAAAAKGLRRMMVQLTAEVMTARGQDPAARKLLRVECGRTGDEGLCERGRSKALPR